MTRSRQLDPPDRASRSIEGMTEVDMLAILQDAQRLRAASPAIATPPLLGKNLALLHAFGPGNVPSLLEGAATQLGVRVAQVRLDDSRPPADGELQVMARMLGLLYDAVDCGPMAPAMAAQIGRHARVPVYEGLDSDDHPASALADLMCLLAHGAWSGDGTAPRFVGDPLAPRAATLLSVAALTDLALCVAVRPMRGTFQIDATHPAAWRLSTPSGPLSQAERVGCHRFVLQAVLLHTIAR